MKNIYTKIKFLTFVICSFFFTSACLEAKDKRELIFADSFPLKHYLSKEAYQWWMKRVTELSDGRITFKHFPAQQLAKGKAALQKISDGSVEVGSIIPGYVSEKLPLNTVVMIPGLISNSTNPSRAYQAMIEDGPVRDEFLKHGVVPLMAGTLPPYQLVLKGQPVKSLKGLEGLKIRSGGGTMNLAVKSVNAQPVSMPSPDIYTAVERGTLDGNLFTHSSLLAYNLHEVVKSSSKNAAFGTVAVCLAMNKDLFESFPEEDQKIFIQAGREMNEHIAQYMDHSILEAQQKLTEAGIELYDIPEGELAKINARLKTVEQSWVERLSGRGLPAQEVLDKFKELLKQ